MFKWLRNKYRSKEIINKTEFYEIIQNNNNVILLDVRSPQEFEENHLRNALNIPTYEIYKKVENIIKDKETIIICYCTLGVRSKKAVRMLKKLGYKNSYYLQDGM